MEKHFFIGRYLSPAQRKKRIIISLCIFISSLILQTICYMAGGIEAIFSLCIIPFVIIAWLLGPWPIPVLGIIQHMFTVVLIIRINGISYYLGRMWLGVIINIIVIGVSILMGVLSNLRQKAMIMAAQLEQVKEEKTKYFINLAHETKTPLTLISNYLHKHILEKGMDPDLAVISTNIEKLKKNMINFLDYEKLERGQDFYNHENYTDLSEALENTTLMFKELAKQKGIKVNVRIEKNISIKADPYAVDRIINNILDNALKYTPDGGRIDIYLKTVQNKIEFIVKDTGIGISAEQLPHIFKSYYQISHEKRNIQGIGMGLNIVKKIIDDIQGNIEVTSALEKGSEFKITFSKLKEHKKQIIKVEPRVRDYSAGKDTHKVLPVDEKSHPDGYTILIVEDNSDMLLFLRDELHNDYNVCCAQNGMQALEKLSNLLDVQLVLSDIMMDIMDGYELYERLEKDERYSHIPVIFLTAKNTQKEKIMALQKGVVDFICKPFDMEELKAKIRSIINISESQFEKSKREIIKHIIEASKSSMSEEKFFDEFNKMCRSYEISVREKEIILLLLDGKQYKEISDDLHISENTVKSHVSHIYEKCGVQNKIELLNVFKHI
jgi:signal transduction histidine kinase/DNA-binding NarL/FixJ family response regulator